MVRIVRFIGVLLLLVPFLSGNITAQEPDNRALSRGSINDQLDYILDKSSKYQDFKVVKETSLRTFRSNVLDTIKKLRSNLKNNQVVIASNKAQMDSVKALLQASNIKLDELSEKETVSAFWECL
ncbi:MAG: hypothetical protein HC831_24120 [Chloroflexia bacterium]|nr:hypothetical protein [Chloroflexia bacterium]